MSDLSKFEELLEMRASETGLSEEQERELREMCDGDPALQLEATMLNELRMWDRRALPSEPELLVGEALRAAPQGPSYLHLVNEEQGPSPVRSAGQRNNRRKLALAALLIGGVSFAAISSDLGSPEPSGHASETSTQEKPKSQAVPATLPAQGTSPPKGSNIRANGDPSDVPRAAPSTEVAPPSSTPPQTEKPQASSIDQLLGRARAATLAGQPQLAAQAYNALLAQYPTSSAAQTVRVSLGKLQLRQLGRPAAAERSFSRYLQRGGPLSREARLGRIDALAALGRKDEERAAIRDYLQRSPQGPVSDRLRERLED